MCNVICNFNLDNLYLISVNIMVSKREGMFVPRKGKIFTREKTDAGRGVILRGELWMAGRCMDMCTHHLIKK